MLHTAPGKRILPDHLRREVPPPDASRRPRECGNTQASPFASPTSPHYKPFGRHRLHGCAPSHPHPLPYPSRIPNLHLGTYQRCRSLGARLRVRESRPQHLAREELGTLQRVGAGCYVACGGRDAHHVEYVGPGVERSLDAIEQTDAEAGRWCQRIARLDGPVLRFPRASSRVCNNVGALSRCLRVFFRVPYMTLRALISLYSTIGHAGHLFVTSCIQAPPATSSRILRLLRGRSNEGSTGETSDSLCIVCIDETRL